MKTNTLKIHPLGMTTLKNIFVGEWVKPWFVELEAACHKVSHEDTRCDSQPKKHKLVRNKGWQSNHLKSFDGF